jgi:hypothetical protein
MQTLYKFAVAIVCFGFLLNKANALDATFEHPLYKGGRSLDRCYYWGGHDCGQRPADLYCLVQGYERAIGFKLVPAEHTAVAYDGRRCDGNCIAFAQITCRTSAPRRGGPGEWPDPKPIDPDQ